MYIGECLRSMLHLGPPLLTPMHFPRIQNFSAAFVTPVCPTENSSLGRMISWEDGAAKALLKRKGMARMVEKRIVDE